MDTKEIAQWLIDSFHKIEKDMIDGDLTRERADEKRLALLTVIVSIFERAIY